MAAVIVFYSMMVVVLVMCWKANGKILGAKNK